MKKNSKKIVEAEAKKLRLDHCKGLHHNKQLMLQISAVNNGYILTTTEDHFVFPESSDMLEFIKDCIPTKGTEQNFLDSLDDDPFEEEDEFELPF